MYATRSALIPESFRRMGTGRVILYVKPSFLIHPPNRGVVDAQIESVLDQFHDGTFNQIFGRFLAHIKDIYNPYMENKFIERLQLTNEELRLLPEPQTNVQADCGFHERLMLYYLAAKNIYTQRQAGELLKNENDLDILLWDITEPLMIFILFTQD
ncbi:hypothetical protein RF11_06214 [Thelohanellus kitauei]|uniref:Uncharacterized protein n=1 Tax=Thelohanellus kitauei TaxID=669202 RepID=A0A0C2IEI5_THEKT|nr:hypothetical protein RF11_06214 [Thelohanellus kitauei]